MGDYAIERMWRSLSLHIESLPPPPDLCDWPRDYGFSWGVIYADVVWRPPKHIVCSLFHSCYLIHKKKLVYSIENWFHGHISNSLEGSLKEVVDCAGLLRISSQLAQMTQLQPPGLNGACSNQLAQRSRVREHDRPLCGICKWALRFLPVETTAQALSFKHILRAVQN